VSQPFARFSPSTNTFFGHTRQRPDWGRFFERLPAPPGKALSGRNPVGGVYSGMSQACKTLVGRLTDGPAPCKNHESCPPGGPPEVKPVGRVGPTGLGGHLIPAPECSKTRYAGGPYTRRRTRASGPPKNRPWRREFFASRSPPKIGPPCFCRKRPLCSRVPVLFSVHPTHAPLVYGLSPWSSRRCE